jgi:hypothetical protein
LLISINLVNFALNFDELFPLESQFLYGLLGVRKDFYKVTDTLPRHQRCLGALAGRELPSPGEGCFCGRFWATGEDLKEGKLAEKGWLSSPRSCGGSF